MRVISTSLENSNYDMANLFGNQKSVKYTRNTQKTPQKKEKTKNHREIAQKDDISPECEI